MSQFTRFFRSIKGPTRSHWRLDRSRNTGSWWDRRESLAPEFSGHCPPVSAEDIAFFKSALQEEGDEARRFFAAFVLYYLPTFPDAVYESMMHAAVYERDPSVNQVFVEPCVRAFGARRVNETLLDYFERGSELEIAGATQAMYWAHPKFELENDCDDYRDLEAFREAVRKRSEPLADIWRREYCLFLQEFVSNSSVMVRQRLIPHLLLKAEDARIYPEELRPLVAQAIEIARNHPDSYIRHRLELQIGSERESQLFSALPPMDELGPHAGLLARAQALISRFTNALRLRFRS